MSVDLGQLNEFIQRLESMESEEFMKLVESKLDDSAVELICSYVERFYEIESDEEVGLLSQLIITGFVMGQELKSPMH